MCIGCTQPPPPFWTVQISGWFCLGRASGANGLNWRLLISHWVSPLPGKVLLAGEPRCKVNDRDGRVFASPSIFGMGRRLLGTRLLSFSGGGPSMTIFTSGFFTLAFCRLF